MLLQFVSIVLQLSLIANHAQAQLHVRSANQPLLNIPQPVVPVLQPNICLMVHVLDVQLQYHTVVRALVQQLAQGV